ncbi:uncharacterized protein LOC100843700 [Brachypodium distachyon]|uniref:Uncharacterized protein n=1 Tax=Brachypodium distachyon TaxID=15368 RepID=I1ISC3_BRADI|nr:uncharacterized protein LOC100843700 [Brachypodium distachyon]KQJ91259.1 hypothetical protein BRADI_4g36640v3 [Brachypodium distachyon]|eukprot:XP_003576783.1 uncharacterized protein LOC100843700 [Brachypodium distachyon]
MKTPQKPAPAPVEQEAFTAQELEAAVQLIHLSESSASSGSTRAARVGLAAGSSSSPRSVNAPPPVVFLAGGEDDWEEEEENEVAGSQRRVKRYRLIAEIYDATEEIGGRSSGKNKKKKE